MGLPYKGMTDFDFQGVVFSQFPPDALIDKVRMKIEMDIMDSVESEISEYKKRYLDGKTFTEKQQKEWDEFFADWRKSDCVISPHTLHMYFFRQRQKEIDKLKPWEVESRIMDQYPGQFLPKYKINLENPNAKMFEEDDVYVVHKDGRIEYRGKRYEEVDDVEFKHRMAMERLEQQIAANEKEAPEKNEVVNEDEKPVDRKPRKEIPFIGHVLDGL